MKNLTSKFLMVSALLLVGQSAAFAAGDAVDITSTIKSNIDFQTIAPIEPTYHKEALIGSPWSRNWFVTASAGTSAFIGTPLGCADLFDRLKPALQLSAGKWFTPAVGGRITYQGWQFKDAAIENHQYHAVHADFLWNVIGMDRSNELGLHRWTLAPFLGAGIIHHEENGKVPFTINYGVMAAYRINKRLSVNLEINGLNTLSDFDGNGNFQRFGDQIYSASAGLTINIGKVGWKRAVDAAPYQLQNELLIAKINDMIREKRNLASDSLLNKNRHGNGVEYSGLASLRARMNGRDSNNKGSELNSEGHANSDSFANADSSMTTDSLSGTFAGTNEERKLIGVPFYLFFNINSTDLTDPSQLQNLVNIAKVAKRYNLKVFVEGAADAATGNDEINDALSKERADYIASILREQGVSADAIRITAKGGINKFSPIQRNRHTRILISD